MNLRIDHGAVVIDVDGNAIISCLGKRVVVGLYTADISTPGYGTCSDAPRGISLSHIRIYDK